METSTTGVKVMKRLTRACADLEESLALIRGPSPSRNRACAKADSIFRIQVQMEARLLWEQEGLGSTPRCPTWIETTG